MATSNHLFLIISLIIPLNPVETTAPTNETNFRHCLSEIISVKIPKPSERLTDSNPPDCYNSSKIFSIGMFELISMSFTGRPGSNMILIFGAKYKILP